MGNGFKFLNHLYKRHLRDCFEAPNSRQFFRFTSKLLTRHFHRPEPMGHKIFVGRNVDEKSFQEFVIAGFFDVKTIANHELASKMKQQVND